MKIPRHTLMGRLRGANEVITILSRAIETNVRSRVWLKAFYINGLKLKFNVGSHFNADVIKSCCEILNEVTSWSVQISPHVRCS